MNEKLRLVREQCIAANPAIMKLEFGCEVLNEVGQREHALFSQYDTLTGKWKVKLDGTAVLMREDEITILGRPIRLADVLLATKVALTTPRLNILADGNIYSDSDDSLGKMFWNLRADDLEKQSEETINFLAELLK